MMSSCASCGKAEGDGIQLRTCTACKSVRYCGVTCQRNHRPQHKKTCKKRAAELRDEILFKQPESSHLGDCLICLLPFSIDEDIAVYHPCCSKVVCKGCVYANATREMDRRLEPTCPFCRDVTETGDAKQKTMKRVQANDPRAMREMAIIRLREGKYAEAVQYYSKAADLGEITAHYFLSLKYKEGGGGFEKDDKKFLFHLEEAAIGGYPEARCGLAKYEETKGRRDRAVKHLIIAANLGYGKSLQSLKELYKRGLVSKEDFAAALRAHKAAVDATKSPQRNEAKRMKI